MVEETADEKRERKNAYMREWYAANKDRQRAYAKKWREANPEKVRTYWKKWRADNYESEKERTKLYAREWRDKNRERVRANDRRSSGLPEPTRPMPLLCELCDKPPDKGRCLALDHCKVTGKFRGWLCNGCNTAIGRLGDDVAGLERAIFYLRAAELRND